MKTNSAIRTMCLIGALACAGCLSEAEGPDSAASTRHRTIRGKPASASRGEEIIRRVTVAEIAILSPQERSADYHRVQPGETLSVIAVRYRTSAEQLARANGLGDPDHLAAGEWLYLPEGKH